MAETIAARMIDDNFTCDETLERASDTERRALLRGRVRRATFTRAVNVQLLREFGISPQDISDKQAVRTFGGLWSFLEDRSPVLMRKRMSRKDMEAEIPKLLALRNYYRDRNYLRPQVGQVALA
jgi:hypothetical protein